MIVLKRDGNMKLCDGRGGMVCMGPGSGRRKDNNELPACIGASMLRSVFGIALRNFGSVVKGNGKSTIHVIGRLRAG